MSQSDHSSPLHQDHWTTQDELSFARHLYSAKKLTCLRNYCAMLHNRDWHAPGMDVEPGVVILQARDWLAELETEDRDRQAERAKAILPINGKVV